MNEIRKLDNHLINKIAAGEVVERPLSVVKELTENAIDAGASMVTVEIRDGGLTQVRVTDNGSGIDARQAFLAFDRHATSKISSADDLFNIHTLGFRGEALASIAAVSQTEMITKTAGAVLGTRLEIHGGQETARQEIGCVNGTTIIVSNLFYNTPARRKFLKKPAAEGGYIADIMQKLALGNPGVTFRFISDGRLILQTNGNGDLKTAVHYVYGREVSSKLIPVRAETAGILLDGYVGKPEIARGNRQYGLFFLNGRVIQSRLLQRAAEDAMKTMLFSGKFPVYILRLTVDPAEVDVNVHPAKTEVRFGDEQKVYQFVYEGLRQALSKQDLIPEVDLRKPARKDVAADLFENIALNETIKGRNQNTYENRAHDKYDASINPINNDSDVGNELNDGAGAALRTDSYAPSYSYLSSSHDFSFHQDTDISPGRGAPGQGETPPARFFTDYIIMGLLFQTYWLVSQGDSLFLIDQHAAHERVLFEEIRDAARQGAVHSQPLLEPFRLRLTPREAQVLQDNMGVFERFGFETREERGGQWVVSAVPFIFKGPLPVVFFTDLLDKMDDVTHADVNLAEYKTETIAMAACKAAVKANDQLSEAEARALLVRLLEMENPYTCPHGRPTVIEITRRELERKFKRVV